MYITSENFEINVRKFSCRLEAAHLLKKSAAFYETKVFKYFFKNSKINSMLKQTNVVRSLMPIMLK
jgi:hypothetical protein